MKGVWPFFVFLTIKHPYFFFLMKVIKDNEYLSDDKIITIWFGKIWELDSLFLIITIARYSENFKRQEE